MKRTFLFFLLPILLLIALEVPIVYLIMPFPGSQLGLGAAELGPDALGRVELAYWLHKHIGWMRVVGGLLIAYPLFVVVTQPRRAWHRYVAGALLLVYGRIV